MKKDTQSGPSWTNPNYLVQAETTFDGEQEELTDGKTGYAPYDQAEKIRKEKEDLREKAFIDTKTGALSANFFNSFKESFDPGRSHNRVGLVYVDVNSLKEVNDTLGHDKGDVLLRGVVAHLKAIFRKGDQVCRIGGDEFVIICTNQEDTENFQAVLESRASEALSSAPKGISFAYGVAVFDLQKDKNIEDTKKRADTAMYRKKREMKAEKSTKNSLGTWRKLMRGVQNVLYRQKY